MERSQIFDMMSTLKLYGMRSAYDEIMASGIKRQHEPPRIVGDLLQSEIAEKQARSIKYQITVAKLPLAKDIDDFDFTDTPVNEGLVRQLASGAFLAEQHNIVLVGGTGTGKSHLSIALARALIRNGARGASTMSSISSIVLKRKRVMVSRGVLPTLSPGSISSLWTSLAIFRSPRPADVAVPPHQQALRANFNHRHHKPDVRRMADCLRRRKMTAALLDRLTHHCEIVETEMNRGASKPLSKLKSKNANDPRARPCTKLKVPGPRTLNVAT